MKIQNFNLVEKYKLWISIPIAILLIAMIAFTGFAIHNKDITKGINIGIDFTGGTVVTITLGEEQLTGDNYQANIDKVVGIITSEEISQKIINYAKDKKDSNGNAIYSEDLSLTNVTASTNTPQTSGSGQGMSLIIKFDNISKTFDKSNDLTKQRTHFIEEEIKSYYSDENGFDAVEVNTNMIGATASSNLIKTALLAVVITLILILLYIIIRFEIWSGIAAVLGLTHDVIFMLCLTVIFNIQINSVFIAAMITIVAYSINNTIVVFDRVRENMKNEKGTTKNEYFDNNLIVNNAIKETLNRSINSTVTTLAAIVIFAILGSNSVREFALPVIFGLIGGFYSSLCLAPSFYCLMKNKADKNSKKKKGFNRESKKKYAGI